MMERYSIVYNVTSNIINSFNSSDKCLFTKSEKTLIRRVKDCIIIFPFGKTLIVHVPSGYERSFPFENELFSGFWSKFTNMDNTRLTKNIFIWDYELNEKMIIS